MSHPRVGNGRRAVRGVVALVVAAIPFVVAMPAAFAGVGIGVTPSFPAGVTVGQSGLPASIQISNTSTPPESAGNVTISSIMLVPSCGTTSFISSGNCPVASADPGVFQLSPTATGEPATSCAGQTFTIVVVDAATGQVSFTPLGGPVVLTPPATPNSVCRIDFNINVLKAPTKAAGVSEPNTVQTAQLGYAAGTSAVTGNIGFGFGSSVVTVTKPAPTGQSASAQQTTNVSVTPGVLSITLTQASVTFGNLTPGTTSPPATIGHVVYTNKLGDGSPWSATVAATSLVSGPAVVPFTGLTFSPGTVVTASAGSSGSVVPGVPGSFAGADPTPGTSFSDPLTLVTAPATSQGTFTQAGSTATLHVPSGAVAGSYAGTLQYTVTG